jgi:hypothetical protein
MGKGITMLPRLITCEQCGETAVIRSYNRVEYDWQSSGQWEFTSVRLIIDCPKCGVKAQTHYPAGEAVAGVK